MERYIVSVITSPGEEGFSLLIPLAPTSSLSTLAAEVKRRLSRLGVGISDITLRLGGVDGPLLDEDDLLVDVIADPKVETITVASQARVTALPAPLNAPQPLQIEHYREIKVRVITPVLARSHKDVRTIPVMHGIPFTSKCTLRELKGRICQHLGIPITDTVPPSQECNCSFARQIDERGLKTALHSQNSDITRPDLDFILVHGKSKVKFLSAKAPSKSSALEAIGLDIGDISSNEINFMGGTLVPGTSFQYSKMPVISVCAKARHELSRSIERGESTYASNELDLHTIESPIELSTWNVDSTLDQLCLTDCVIEGVLNIYAVERKMSGASARAESGKDAIFLNGDAWMHTFPQSERGMAMLLSSLRVFNTLIGAKKMDGPSQDAILHLFYLLSNFPPAVRAIHIMMNDKSPRLCEQAALGQTIYEILKDVVPLKLVNSDAGRLFEGSRLLFGLILEKAKHLKLKGAVQMPYISSFVVMELLNTFTMEPIAYPVQTAVGVVEQGYHDALKEGGTISWKTGEMPLSTLPLDRRTSRIFNLYGGNTKQATIFNFQSSHPATRYPDEGDIDSVIFPKELADLRHLSALCTRNNLSVIPPSNVPSAEPPILTLDRNGNLAVYVGRAACAVAGKDITIFRPTSGGEEIVDVSIITQLLIPIQEQREADGTSIFDAFGDGFERKFKAPDEIVVVCVDCSTSMEEPADFAEIEEDDSVDSDTHVSTVTTFPDQSAGVSVALDELKTSILEHESFPDMVSIVRDATGRQRRDAASKVLKILRSLASQKIATYSKRLEALKSYFPRATYREGIEVCISEIEKLKAVINGLGTHEQALCDFLIYRAVNSTAVDSPWTWVVGDSIPRVLKTPSDFSASLLSEEMTAIPLDYLCPISKEIMENPVRTSDGFTFERGSIETWFQIRNSSPLTGLLLTNTDLEQDRQREDDVKLWINGSDVLQSFAVPVDPSQNSQQLNIRFFTSLRSFNRKVPETISISGLYKLAFRGMKARHSNFQLHSKDTFLPPSETPISTTNIHNNAVIHVKIPEPVASSATNQQGNSEVEELCLIKVYHLTRTVLFSYWTPKDTTNTLGSIIFRYWRHVLRENVHRLPRDIYAWTSMIDRGDGHLTGDTQDHWDQLSEFLDSTHATGKLRSESVFDVQNPEIRGHSSADSDDSDEDIDMDNSDLEDDYDAATPLVFKIFVGVPSDKAKQPRKNLSRLDALKSMFDAFINRVLAYNYQTHIGLITFESSATVSQSITHSIEKFRHSINDMIAHGDTALWDAIALANDQIIEYAKKFPNAKKRIICLSDGNDNKSKLRSHDVSLLLHKNKVVVDSFCLGDEDNLDLCTISYLSGGYKFTPASMQQAVEICEMEPVLNQLERPDIKIPREAHSHSYDAKLRFIFARDNTTTDLVTNDVFPRRKEHPNVNDHFVQLSSVNQGGQSSARDTSGAVSIHTGSNLRTSRILSEIRNIVANPHQDYDVYLSQSNMAFWKVVMNGPRDSPYSTGTFVLYLDMEDDYPSFAPKCRFMTPIYHPNINKHGKVCHSILDRNWTSDTSNYQVISQIYSLLLIPEFSDPINVVVSLELIKDDQVEFREEIKKHISENATKSRAEWKKELLGE